MNYVALGAAIRHWEMIVWSVMLFLGFVAYTRERGWKILLGTAITIRLAIAAVLSFAQYQTWAAPGHGLTQIFLPPKTPITYFLMYAWTNFISPQVLGIGFALVVWIGFWALTKYRGTAFLPEEPLMGTFALVVLGWPRSILLLPLTLIVVTVQLAVLQALKRADRMMLGAWFLGMSIIVMIFGNDILNAMHLKALFIGQ
jgi:hypothetical protein